ncbi:hypothetical protein TUM17383_13690 [Shewanella algae]|nr:hypothetical protein TUM17383_13690 [Shewanella algae]
MLITVHSALEHALNMLCKIVAFTMGSKIKHTDFNDSGVRRAFKFLSNVSGFNLSVIENEKNIVDDVSQIRNAIVHSGGVIDSSNKKLIGIINSAEFIKGAVGHNIYVENEFINYYIEVIICLFEKLGSEIHIFIVTFPRD